jgi:hypothetical protein
MRMGMDMDMDMDMERWGGIEGGWRGGEVV